MITVSAGPELDGFRQHELSGQAVLHRLAGSGGQILVNVAVGVGKSTCLDGVAEEAVRSGRYDLVIVLCPTCRTLAERRWVKDKPDDIKVRVLKRRPSSRCGEARDAQWRRFEQRGLGLLGRKQLCGSCPRLSGCPWPRQYGKALKGVQAIFATQSHLQRDPMFISQIQGWAGASKVLVIIDENDVTLASYKRQIRGADLRRFVEILNQLPATGERWEELHKQWAYRAGLLRVASQADLCAPGWFMPAIRPQWALHVQELGCQKYREDFRFLAHELEEFGRSDRASRERSPDGGLQYASPPRVTGDLIVFSATCVPEFAKFRLGVELANPYCDHRFVHPDTRWFNIASPFGAMKYFPGNADQILDFFAQLVAQRWREGRRCLLIAKKALLETCMSGMARRLAELGLADLTVLSKGWTPEQLARRNVIPLIHYGLIGTNLFEDFDCAYCLCSYNVPEQVIDAVLQDVTRTEAHIPLKIHYDGSARPRRRVVSVVDPANAVYDVQRLARPALLHMEMDVVLQAVGRVRPFTRPREVIMFQCGQHPQVPYDKEFDTLQEARRHFSVPTRRHRRQLGRHERIAQARNQGMTQEQAAAFAGVGLRTAQRHWNEPANSPLGDTLQRARGGSISAKSLGLPHNSGDAA